MLPSGLAVVGPCRGLAKSCDEDTALIHASEIVRLGPGPVTASWTVPMAADVGAARAAGSGRGARAAATTKRWSRCRGARAGRHRGGADEPLHLGARWRDGHQVVEHQRPVDGRVQDGRPPSHAGRVRLVGRHHEVVLGHLCVEGGDLRLQRADIVLLVVHLEELPGTEGHQEDHDAHTPDQRALLDPLHPGPLGHLGRQEVELLDRLVGLGEGQADGRGEHRAHLVHLDVGEVQLRRVQASQGRHREHGQVDLVLEHGEEAVAGPTRRR